MFRTPKSMSLRGLKGRGNPHRRTLRTIENPIFYLPERLAMEHNEHKFAERDSFETGSTIPPKTRGGIIAVLLVTVIFLAGFLRVLSLLNIGLFPPKPGNGTGILSGAVETCTADVPSPGFAGETVTELTQRFHRYPDGVLIRQVTPGSSADIAGVEAGDVLVQLDGEKITDTATLQTVLQARRPGDKVSAVFSRGSISYTCLLTLTTP